MTHSAADKPIFDAFRLLTGPITSDRFAGIKKAIAASTVSDKPIFDYFASVDDDDRISAYEFGTLKKAILAYQQGDVAELVVETGETRDMSPKALKSMSEFEGYAKRLSNGSCTAYPDPGSRDGRPWTIGYGSTGPDVRKGVVWTQPQAYTRMIADVRRFEDGVERILGGTRTTQAQFDAFVHFAYNVGVRAFQNSTLLKRHRARLTAQAADQFLRWNKNDGKVMAGLTRRRHHERDMYLGKA